MRNQSLVGSVTAASRFEDTRKVLGERLSNVVHSIVHINDEIAEKARLFSSLRQYSMLSASMHTCAVAAATATATELLEPTPGLMALSSLFLGGGACYMIGTSRVEKQYQQQWSNCAQQLDDALDNICKKELLRVHRRILDGVGPYIRFVETEQERIDHLRGQCEGVSSAARNLRNRISKIE